MDVDRLGVTDKIKAFIETTKTPFAQMTTGKAIIYEGHPLFKGTYNGDFSKPEVKDFVEGADFLLTVSPRFIEWNSGAFSHDLACASYGELHKDYMEVSEEVFEAVDIHDVLDKFLAELATHADYADKTSSEEERKSIEETAAKPADQSSFNYGWRGMKEMGEEDRFVDL